MAFWGVSGFGGISGCFGAFQAITVMFWGSLLGHFRVVFGGIWGHFGTLP